MLSLTLAAILIGAVLVLIARRHLPVSSLPVTIFLLGLGGAVLGLLFTFRLIAPAISRKREHALVQILANVTAGKYPAAPDEVWLFKRRGWWTRTRELTPLGEAVLAQGRGEGHPA
ncbi:hypothetical protein DEIPH_ctg139orf0147 [Deinococcus phoenicis]|uniref:Uncharacterized protein n=1 Tax=Deinococcus phoenicis TaxID=1476583 RepID=A0A016QK28_9DEIO|nr:hypothetical protein DEIPH_ctg139orf0147 [Deinococcus phoenicis]